MQHEGRNCRIIEIEVQAARPFFYQEESMKTCLLVMTHGSRSRDYGLEFDSLLDDIRKRNLYDDVRGCYLQFQEPSLPDAVEMLGRDGFEHVILVPYFLFQGFHIQRDIPEMLRRCEGNYPSMSFSLAAPLGYDPVLTDLVLARAESAISLKDKS